MAIEPAVYDDGGDVGPLVMIDTGEDLIPSVSEDPCDCCGDYVCTDECSGGLPSVLAVTISGWTVPSLQVLNGTWSIDYLGNCVWQSDYEILGACDYNDCDSYQQPPTYTFRLRLEFNILGDRWRFYPQINEFQGILGYVDGGINCSFPSQPFNSFLDESYTDYSSPGSPAECTGDVTLTDVYNANYKSVVGALDDGECGYATQDRPLTCTLHLP